MLLVHLLQKAESCLGLLVFFIQPRECFEMRVCSRKLYTDDTVRRQDDRSSKREMSIVSSVEQQRLMSHRTIPPSNVCQHSTVLKYISCPSLLRCVVWQFLAIPKSWSCVCQHAKTLRILLFWTQDGVS